MVNQFLRYLRYERNRSELTVKSYEDDLRGFQLFFENLDESLSWSTIDSDIIRLWMEHMMDKGNTARSINRRLSALRSFYRFALAHHLVSKDPVYGLVGPKNQKTLPQFLRESEMDNLLDRPVDDPENYINVRARTIILMFYTTGIRLAELIGLDDASVDFLNGQIKVTGKRDKQRVIPFGEELKAELRNYMRLRDKLVPVNAPALFLTKKGERMNRQQVRREVQKQLATVCTLKKKSPHVLRHTFATAMLNHEAGLESVKKLLGHERISTTEIYTHTTFEQLKRAYMNAHPRA